MRKKPFAVPNIEEINAWLGGTTDTVVRSDYRPALAEFARLDSAGSGINTTITLRFHPQEATLQFDVDRFLSCDDFRYRNAETGRDLPPNSWGPDSGVRRRRGYGSGGPRIRLG